MRLIFPRWCCLKNVPVLIHMLGGTSVLDLLLPSVNNACSHSFRAHGCQLLLYVIFSCFVLLLMSFLKIPLKASKTSLKMYLSFTGEGKEKSGQQWDHTHTQCQFVIQHWWEEKQVASSIVDRYLVFLLFTYSYIFCLALPLTVNKHKPWIETTYHGIVTENDDKVLLDPPLIALDKDAPLRYAGERGRLMLLHLFLNKNSSFRTKLQKTSTN